MRYLLFILLCAIQLYSNNWNFLPGWGTKKCTAIYPFEHGELSFVACDEKGAYSLNRRGDIHDTLLQKHCENIISGYLLDSSFTEIVDSSLFIITENEKSGTTIFTCSLPNSEDGNFHVKEFFSRDTPLMIDGSTEFGYISSRNMRWSFVTDSGTLQWDSVQFSDYSKEDSIECSAIHIHYNGVFVGLQNRSNTPKGTLFKTQHFGKTYECIDSVSINDLISEYSGGWSPSLQAAVDSGITEYGSASSTHHVPAPSNMQLLKFARGIGKTGFEVSPAFIGTEKRVLIYGTLRTADEKQQQTRYSWISEPLSKINALYKRDSLLYVATDSGIAYINLYNEVSLLSPKQSKEPSVLSYSHRRLTFSTAHLSRSPVEILITNLQGKVLYSGTEQHNSSNSNTINLPPLAANFYILQLKQNGLTTSQLFQVK